MERGAAAQVPRAGWSREPVLDRDLPDARDLIERLGHPLGHHLQARTHHAKAPSSEQRDVTDLGDLPHVMWARARHVDPDVKPQDPR